ncbi:MAG: transferase [Burkholderiales bacterium]|nr:transferase [Burkholderiales bacterium]
MMGFLLHNPTPASIVMIGLGGGSLAKFCYRYLPNTSVTVIEVNPHVLAHRTAFAIPPDDDRFEVLLADGAAFMRDTTRKFDVVLADGFDIDGLPDRLSAQAFYDDCFNVLNPGGMFVANLHGCNPFFAVFMDRIEDSFGAPVLMVEDPSGSNRLVFAVKDAMRALQSLAGIRCPLGFDPLAWKAIQPSMARVFLASTALDHGENRASNDINF